MGSPPPSVRKDSAVDFAIATEPVEEQVSQGTPEAKPMFGASPSAFIQQLTGVDPTEARERERDRREREQAKLYRLVVLIAAVSAFASIASVAVAVVNG